jgi:hypothetical protein
MHAWTVYLIQSEISHAWCHRTERIDAFPAVFDIGKRPPDGITCPFMTRNIDRLM